MFNEKKLFSCVLKLFFLFQVSFLSSAFCLLSLTLLINILLPRGYEEPFCFIFLSFLVFFLRRILPMSGRSGGGKIHFLFIKSTEKSLLSLNAEILLTPTTTTTQLCLASPRLAPSYITINEEFSLKDFPLT